MEVSVAKLIWVAQPLSLLPPTWLLPFSSATLSWVVGNFDGSLWAERKKKKVLLCDTIGIKKKPLLFYKFSDFYHLL